VIGATKTWVNHVRSARPATGNTERMDVEQHDDGGATLILTTAEIRGMYNCLSIGGEQHVGCNGIDARMADRLRSALSMRQV